MPKQKRGKQKISLEEKKRRRIKKYFIHHKWAVLALAIVFVVLSTFILWQIFITLPAQSYSDSYLKNLAAKYTTSVEKTATPVIINYFGRDYYYVPFTVNGNLNGTFPGIMFDSKAKPVTIHGTLKELFKYPSVINETASTLSGFNSAVNTKARAVTQYCTIINKQETQLRETVANGSMVGLMYYGAKLAFDAVALVKTGVQGLGALLKDLATNAVQDSITDYVTGYNSRAALTSANSAYNASKQASRYCAQARSAWQSLKTTSGSITPEKAKNATYALNRMFTHERTTMSHLRNALKRINNYPTIITKIGSSDYKNGMAGLENLMDKLYTEQKYWYQEDQDVKTFLSDWANEQIDRVKNPPNSGSSSGSTSCNKGKNGGLSYCTKSCPCDIGYGDCDYDYECKTGLKCSHNIGKKYGLFWNLDFCEKKATSVSSPATVSSPTTGGSTSATTNCRGSKKQGNWSYCSKSCPCDAGYGDCDYDYDCKTGYCHMDVGKKYGFRWDMDFCEKKASPVSTSCHKGKNGGLSYCTKSCPCDVGKGDCDYDYECKTGLKCSHNIGKKYGFFWNLDFCEKK